MIENKKYGAVLADKCYDTDAIVAHVTEGEALCVIPPKKNQKALPNYDKELYKERHKIECMM